MKKLKLFSLALMALFATQMWGADPIENEGTYSTQVISADGKTSTWTFILPSSQVTLPTGETKDNDVIYAPSGSSKMKFSSSNGLSWAGKSSGYFYVPSGAAGTISMTVKSSSDTRHLQLYVGGEAAAETKRLYSKANSGEGISSDGKKGPQSFSFTSSDITTKGDSTFLHFKDNDSEMKIATISITLTTGTYITPSCDDPESTIKADTTLYVDDSYNIGFNSINTSGCSIDVKKNGATATEDVDYEKSSVNDYTFLKAGEFVITISQAADAGGHCAVEESVTVTVNAKTPVTSVAIDGPASGYIGDKLTYTATAANATQYQWWLDGVQQGSDSAKFIYTAAKGDHSIVCKARNNFNEVGEWISSTPKALTVTNPSGVLIAATAETSSGSIDKNITATGIIGGTVHQKTQKNAKLGSSGHYFSLTLSSGSFLEGDTVKVVVTPEYSSEKETYSAPSVLKISTIVDNTNLIGESDTKTIDPASSADLYFDIVLTDDASIIYLARDGSICKQNPIVKSISVVRPKEVKSVTETLTNVKINGVAISAANLATLLADESLDLADDYIDAPTVKFFKNIRTTYEDDTYADKTDSTAVEASEVAGKWQATDEINEVEYTVTMVKTASFTVTYKLGSRTLGSESVLPNGNPAEYATYEDLSDGGLSSFNNWYSKSDLSGDAVTIDEAVITKDTTFYADFTFTYASSINIEQLILDNSKAYDTKAQLGTRHYASNYSGTDPATSKARDISNDSLDTYQNKGALRNYAYLGLKVKSNGSLLGFRLAPGSEVQIKFGNVAATPHVSINGGDYAAMTITDGVYSYTATGEDYVSFKTMDKNAVVIKQIAIDEDLANVVYTITCADATNGSVSCNWGIAIPGETVELTLAPDAGYKVASVAVNEGEPLEVSDNKASFTMPSAAANVVATFSSTVGFDNIDEETKAVKVLENGQVVIFKDGKYFNVLGIQIR